MHTRCSAAELAAVALADRAVRPRLVALVVAATGWREGAGEHADHHHALQRHHRHAGEQATAALDRVCILRIGGGEVDIGPGVRTPAQLGHRGYGLCNLQAFRQMQAKSMESGPGAQGRTGADWSAPP